MICDDCGRARPTRFVILGKAIGMLVVSIWQERGDHLCEPCLRKRYSEWMGVTAATGWWGPISFVRTLRILPANAVEFRRAMALEPVPADPTDADRIAAAENQARVQMVYAAEKWIWWGSAAALTGLVFLVAALSMDAGHSDRGMLTWGGTAFFVPGAACVLAGLAQRKSARAAKVRVTLPGGPPPLPRPVRQERRPSPAPPAAPPPKAPAKPARPRISENDVTEIAGLMGSIGSSLDALSPPPADAASASVPDAVIALAADLRLLRSSKAYPAVPAATRTALDALSAAMTSTLSRHPAASWTRAALASHADWDAVRAASEQAWIQVHAFDVSTLR